MASQRFYAQGAGRLPMPKSRKSVVSVALGGASLGFGPLTAVPAVLVGGAAWLELRRHPTWIRGRSLVVSALLLCVAGMLLFWTMTLPMWRLRTWIAALESAETLLAADREDVALDRIETAIQTNVSSDVANAVARLRRAELALIDNRLDAALAEIDDVIESLTASVTATPYSPYPVAKAALQAAHFARADVYDAMGRFDDAAAERQWYEGMLTEPQSPEGGDAEPAPPAPPPPEPAPVADPAA